MRNGNTYKNTNTQTETDILPKYKTESSKKNPAPIRTFLRSRWCSFACDSSLVSIEQIKLHKGQWEERLVKSEYNWLISFLTEHWNNPANIHAFYMILIRSVFMWKACKIGLTIKNKIVKKERFKIQTLFILDINCRWIIIVEKERKRKRERKTFLK